jgi:hypothetical protein
MLIVFASVCIALRNARRTESAIPSPAIAA